MSDFKTMRVSKWKCLRSLTEMREFLVMKVPSVDVGGEKPDLAVVGLGYVEPGHGSKGRKQWLYTDEDIMAMYEKHKGKSAILFWMHSTPPTTVSRPKASSVDCVQKSWKSGTNFEEHKESFQSR